MAATKGKDGGVYLGSTLITFIDTWQLDGTIMYEETTAYGDTHIARVPTFRDWAGSFAGTLDRSDAQQAALLDQFEDGTLAAQVVRLATSRGSSYWEGSALMEKSSVASSVSGKVSVSFNFIGAGTLTWTSA